MMVRTRTITLTADQAAVALLLIIAVTAALLVVAASVLPPAVDWSGWGAPASHALLRGENPYRVPGFYNPAWALLPLAPFSFDATMGRAGLFVVSLGVYALAAKRMGASPVAAGLFISSPPILHTLLNGNVEWVVFTALLLPPTAGMFAALVKPQVGIGLAAWYAIEAWRTGGARRLAIVAGPVMLVTLGTLALWGWWPGLAAKTPQQWFNAAIWPYGVPLGAGLMGLSIRKRNAKFALAAAPLVSPYVLFHSWAGALLALAGQTRWLALAVGALWLLILWRLL